VPQPIPAVPDKTPGIVPLYISPTKDAKKLSDNTLNQKSVSMYEAPHVLKPFEPLLAEASKNFDNPLRQKQEAYNDELATNKNMLDSIISPKEKRQ
jgi:hypothetical protein